MKRRTDKFLIGSCLLAFTGCIFYLVYIFALQEGISRGKALGALEPYEDSVCSIIDPDLQIIAEEKYVLEQQLQEVTRKKNDYKHELSRCRQWVDGLGADLVEARSIIRGMK